MVDAPACPRCGSIMASRLGHNDLSCLNDCKQILDCKHSVGRDKEHCWCEALQYPKDDLRRLHALCCQCKTIRLGDCVDCLEDYA